jgi:hypothetical protein
MQDKLLFEKIAYLESLNDHLATELKYVDRLLRKAGFTEGLHTLKYAAIEMIRLEKSDENSSSEEISEEQF